MSKEKTAMAIAIYKTEIFKPIKVCHLRDFQHQFHNGKITYSRMVELLNETYQSELKKILEELRSTVEKEQIIVSFDEGAKICSVSNLTKKNGEKSFVPLYGYIHYNEKYGADE